MNKPRETSYEIVIQMKYYRITQSYESKNTGEQEFHKRFY